MSDIRPGSYDPFEDTGDWPFRDAPPRSERPRPEPRQEESLYTSLGDTAVDAPAPEDRLEDVAPDEVAAEVAAEDAAPDQVAAEDAAAVVEDPSDPVSEEPELVVPEVGESPPAAVEEAHAPVGEPVDEQAAAAPDVAVGEEEDLPVAEEHAPGGFAVPPGPEVLEGGPHGFRRNVAVVVSRFNGDVTSQMLDVTLAELRDCHVTDEAITVVPVPGAFELPLAALALAKTRRFSCIIALGCVIRGETAHFDLVAGEAASGLQLAAIETGIPVSFGVLTCETREQAEARIDRAADAARTALEMADLFSQVRTRAAG